MQFWNSRVRHDRKMSMRTIMVVILLSICTSVFAQDLPAPSRKSWIVLERKTWNDAAADMITSNGEHLMLKTGDVETPYLSLAHVEGLTISTWAVETHSTPLSAALKAMTLSKSWLMTAPDGKTLLIYKKP